MPILNEEFAPSKDEVDSAHRIVAAYEQAVAAGRGSIAIDGKMVDVPVVERAHQTLRRAAAIEIRRKQGNSA